MSWNSKAAAVFDEFTTYRHNNWRTTLSHQSILLFEITQIQALDIKSKLKSAEVRKKERYPGAAERGESPLHPVSVGTPGWTLRGPEGETGGALRAGPKQKRRRAGPEPRARPRSPLPPRSPCSRSLQSWGLGRGLRSSHRPKTRRRRKRQRL